MLTENQGDYKKMTVIDSLTGEIWTYQHGAGVPSELPVAMNGSPTEAAFDAMPHDPSALRALLLTRAKQQQAQAAAQQQQQQRILAGKGKKVVAVVLADTPGVVVNTHATDMTGRPAVEISRLDSAEGIDYQTFENPATGAVLETAFVHVDTKTEGTDLHQSVTGSNTLPPNPYQY